MRSVFSTVLTFCRLDDLFEFFKQRLHRVGVDAPDFLGPLFNYPILAEKLLGKVGANHDATEPYLHRANGRAQELPRQGPAIGVNGAGEG